MRNTVFSVVAVALACLSVSASEPLHQRIDRLIASQVEGAPAPLADDAAFLRRLCLDFSGRIPSAEQVKQFLDDPSPNKRAAAIDRLLDAPAYVDRMANLFHVALMERRGEHEEWDKFLRACFEQNMPWDDMARKIINPDATDERFRGAAFFYTKRLEKYGQNPTDFPGLTRDVGRLFLGVDLQCAECHDHLFISDYRQREFKGLFAAYQNLSIRKEKFPAVNEKAMAEKLEFVSVFADATQQTGPRIPFGKEFDIPAPTEESAKKKGKADPNRPPSFSALSRIAAELPQSDSELFARNIVNRLWFSMMGRGLVEPLDQFHSANPPTHPELLDLLANEFADQDFNIQWLLRELALTQTYQRSSQWDADAIAPGKRSYRVASQRRLTAEQLFVSVLQATGNLQRLAPPSEAPSEEFKDLKSRFVKAFANEAKEPAIGYTPAVKQALFLLNDSKVLDLLKPHEGNLAQRLKGMRGHDAIADELYLSVFCRLPDAPERAMVRDYLQQQEADRTKALGDLIWAMISSMEFCVNH